MNARLTDVYKDTAASQPQVENLTTVDFPLHASIQAELQLDGTLSPAVSYYIGLVCFAGSDPTELITLYHIVLAAYWSESRLES